LVAVFGGHGIGRDVETAAIFQLGSHRRLKPTPTLRKLKLIDNCRSTRYLHTRTGLAGPLRSATQPEIGILSGRESPDIFLLDLDHLGHVD